jgi:hypothetical protein
MLIGLFPMSAITPDFESHQSRRVRIVLTARDPASAQAASELGRALVNDGRFFVVLITQDPASRLLENSEHVAHHRISLPLMRSKSALEATTRKLFARINPKIVIAGISSIEFGIDEAALAVAPKKKYSPYALQTYWGDINRNWFTKASTYLVIDRYAGKVTQKRTGSRALIVGSPKHAHYPSLDVGFMRSEFRKRLSVEDGSGPLVALFGQPFPPRHSYYQTLVVFAERLGGGNSGNATIVYRPHPKESARQGLLVNKIFSKYRLNFYIDDFSCCEYALSGCDYAVSAFSTCGYDMQRLIHVSPLPLGVPVYLFYDPLLRFWYKNYTSLDHIPMSKRGMAVVLENDQDILKILDEKFLADTRKKCAIAVKEHFVGSDWDSARVVEMLIQNINREKE